VVAIRGQQLIRLSARGVRSRGLRFLSVLH
jgi:hypothetical protein